jgi:hypothetical protein
MRAGVLVLQNPLDLAPDLSFGDALHEGFQVAREDPDELVVLQTKGPELELSTAALGEPAKERMVESRVASGFNLQGAEEAFCRHQTGWA